MSKLLTVMFNVRNDNYYDNNIERIQYCLNYNLQNIIQLKETRNVEFLIIDWGSKVPISKIISVYNKGKNLVNFINVNHKIAEANSRAYFNNFNPVKSNNIGFRRAVGNFILHAAHDQILTYKNWQYLLIFLKENIKNSHKIYYIPRKIINNNFALTFPTFSELDRTLELSASSNLDFRAPSFFVGGGYSALMKKNLFYKIRGQNESENPVNSAGDVDIHNRSMYYVDKEDLGHKGIFFYKLPPFNLDGTNQRKLLKESGIRKFPENPRSLNPNNKNWGMSNYKFIKTKAQNTLNLKEINHLTLFKKKIEIKYESINFIYFLKAIFKVTKTNFFFNISINNFFFDVKILLLTTNLKIKNIFFYGYNNNYLLSLIGKELEWLSLFSYDFYSIPMNKNINKQQMLLSLYFQSLKRFGYYKPVFLDKKYNIKNITKNIQGNSDNNFIQIICNEVPDNFIKYFFKWLNKEYETVGYLLLKDCKKKKIFAKIVTKNFNIFKFNKSDYLLTNKKNKFNINFSIYKILKINNFIIIFFCYSLTFLFNFYKFLLQYINFRRF